MLLIFFAEISTIGVRRSGWKIEVLGVDERGRWLASSPSGTFPRFPRSRLSLPGPSSYNATTSAWIQILVNKRLT